MNLIIYILKNKFALKRRTEDKRFFTKTFGVLIENVNIKKCNRNMWFFLLYSIVDIFVIITVN